MSVSELWHAVALPHLIGTGLALRMAVVEGGPWWWFLFVTMAAAGVAWTSLFWRRGLRT